MNRIRERIAEAAGRVGRDPGDVTLIAVSKMVSVDGMREAYDAGQRDFGESRLQEAIPKIDALPTDVVWHFIGPLQSNKAKRVSTLFDVIHSFDNEGQVREAAKAPQPAAGLIQVNIGREPQKEGVPPDALQVATFADYVRAQGIEVRGLMAIGPDIGAEAMRPYFKELRALSHGGWLSMGMSGDYEVAIEEGATHVRVGSAIFGP